MDGELELSFKQDLVRIVSRYKTKMLASSSTLGESIAKEIILETKSIKRKISSVKNGSLYDFVFQNYRLTIKYPKFYEKNGCENCNELFFEHTIKTEDYIAFIGFYLPSLFKKKKSRPKSCNYIKDCIEKSSNKNCIKFYFAICSVPDVNL